MSKQPDWTQSEQEQERIRREALEFAGIGLCLYQFDGTILRIDNAVLRLLELDDIYRSEAAAIGKNIADLIQHTVPGGVLREILRTTNEVHGHEYPLKTLKGNTRWILRDAYLVKAPETGENVILSVVRDITAQKLTEQALRMSQICLDAVDETLLVIHVQTGYILESNSRVADMYGVSREEIRGHSFGELSAGSGPYTLPEALRLLTGAERPLFEWRARHATGRLFWAEISAKPIVYHDVDCVLATVREIGQRKEAEQELLRIREALDDSQSSVLMVNGAMQATYLNAAFGALFGYTTDRARDIVLANVFVDPLENERVMAHVLAGGNWEGEVQMLSREHTAFPASLRVTPILDDEFDIEGVLFIINDITQMKHMESQLLQSQNLKSIGSLAAGIAHEINTPMQYIGDNIRFLRDSFDDLLRLTQAGKDFLLSLKKITEITPAIEDMERKLTESDFDYLVEEIPASIQQSLEGIDHVAGIVRAMRQFTHPGTDEKKLIDLNQTIENTIIVARNEWKYVADLDTSLDPDLPLVPCLPGDINQVLLNLIVNAAHAIADVVGDASGGKGTITVSTAHGGDWAEVRVRDTGTGIPEAIREQVFSPFFTTKEVGKGTGQGLAISHAVIVDKHRGSLTFETEEGQGTTFLIRLPLDAAAMQEPSDVPAISAIELTAEKVS